MVDFQKIMTMSKTEDSNLFSEAQEEYSKNNFSKAIELLDIFLMVEPNNAQAHLLKGKSVLRTVAFPEDIIENGSPYNLRDYKHLMFSNIYSTDRQNTTKKLDTGKKCYEKANEYDSSISVKNKYLLELIDDFLTDD